MIDDLVPVCKDCLVVCQYVSATPDWGLECPRCGKSRVSPAGLEPTPDQAAYEARNRAQRRASSPHPTRAPRGA